MDPDPGLLSGSADVARWIPSAVRGASGIRLHPWLDLQYGDYQVIGCWSLTIHSLLRHLCRLFGRHSAPASRSPSSWWPDSATKSSGEQVQRGPLWVVDFRCRTCGFAEGILTQSEGIRLFGKGVKNKYTVCMYISNPGKHLQRDEVPGQKPGHQAGSR